MEYVVLLENKEYEGKIDIEEPVIFAVTDAALFIQETTKNAFDISTKIGMWFLNSKITIGEKEYPTNDIVAQGRKKNEYRTLLLTFEEFNAKLLKEAISV